MDPKCCLGFCCFLVAYGFSTMHIVLIETHLLTHVHMLLHWGRSSRPHCRSNKRNTPLTPGQSVLALTLLRQVPNWVAHGVLICNSSDSTMESGEEIIIMIMITLKGAIQDFHNLLTARQTVSYTYAHMARAQLCANHVQHIKRLSSATFVPCDATGQLSY